VQTSPRGGGVSEHLAQAKVAGWPKRTYAGCMLLSRLDAWVGRTLFIPPIIKLCQLTRQTQFAVPRLFWFIAALDGFYRAQTLFSSVLWGAMSVVMMVTAARRADSPTASFMFFRMLALLFLLLGAAKGAVTGDWAGIEFWLLVLVAEYAATIRTVPPKQSSRKGAVEAQARR
jgi:hypothetical protein